MSTEVMVRPDVRVAPISKSFDEMMRVAETLLKSGFLPYSIKTPAQAVAIILMGREVGLPEMQALRSINVIQGKPTLSSELMLALFSARVNGEAKILKSDDEACEILFKRPGREPHTRRFTIDDARRLGFVGKDNYNKQPATMLQWRCVSAGLRFYAPDALAGISYTPDELGATVNPDTGEVLDLTLAREVPADDDVPAVDVRADVGGVLPPDPAPPTATSAQGEIVAPEAAQAPKKGKDYPFLREMGRQKERLGAAVYYQILGSHGYEHSYEITDRAVKVKVFKELQETTVQPEGV